MIEANDNLYGNYSGIAVSGSYSLSIGLAPGASGYETAIVFGISNSYERVSLQFLRQSRGATNTTLCGAIVPGTISAPGAGPIPGEFMLLSPATNQTDTHDGEFTPFPPCCCPCQPVLLMPAHDPTDPADVPPTIGTITNTWVDADGMHPDPHTLPPTEVLYGWGATAIFPRRCRNTFYNPDEITYTYTDFAGVTLMEVTPPVFIPDKPKLNRTAEWTAIANGTLPRGAFTLNWNTPTRKDGTGGGMVILNFNKPEYVTTDPVAVLNGQWVLQSFTAEDEDFDITNLQITNEENGVRIGFIGPYLFETDLADLTLAADNTQSLTGPTPLTQIVTITAIVYTKPAALYVPWGTPGITSDMGLDCLGDFSTSGTVDLSDAPSHTTGGYTFSSSWS